MRKKIVLIVWFVGWAQAALAAVPFGVPLTATATFSYAVTTTTLAVSGTIRFDSPLGLVRVLAQTSGGVQLLIYELTPLMMTDPVTTLAAACLETCALRKAVTVTAITVQVESARLTLTALPTTRPRAAPDARLATINANLRAQGALWVAGETSVSQLSYAAKRRLLFGAGAAPPLLPNLYGLEYYRGGVFTLPGALSPQPRGRATYPAFFSWRRQHGRNWLTSVKDQWSCGSCWAFAAAGAFESIVALYFNDPLDLDFSEQDLLDCAHGIDFQDAPGTTDHPAGNCTTGSPNICVKWYTRPDGQAIADALNPYVQAVKDCQTDRLATTVESFRASGWGVALAPATAQDYQALLLEHGPMLVYLPDWAHEAVFTGYGTIRAGDSLWTSTLFENLIVPEGHAAIGAIYFEIKNEWGTNWGEQGYMRLLMPFARFNSLQYWTYPIVSSFGRQVRCTDRDGDGFYFWGLGDRPASCPANARWERDCDDSTGQIGERRADYTCARFAPSVTVTITGTAGGTVTPRGRLRADVQGDLAVTVTPNAGYVIAAVLVNSVSVGAVSAYTLSNPTGNTTIHAVFQRSGG